MLVSKRQEDVVFVSFEGTTALDIANADLFRKEIERMLSGARTVVLDMHNLDFVDSAGLRALIWLRRELAQKGRRLILYRMSPRVREIMEVTRLIRIFATCSSPMELRRALDQGKIETSRTDRAKLQSVIYPHGAVLQVLGVDTLGQEDARAVVRQVGSLTRPGRPVILDLRPIQYVDAAALSFLTDALHRAKEAKSSLYALVASDTLAQIFKHVPAWQGHVLHSEKDLSGLTSTKPQKARQHERNFVDLGLVLGEAGKS